MLQPGVVLFDQLSDEAEVSCDSWLYDFYLRKDATIVLKSWPTIQFQYEIEQINHDIQQIQFPSGSTRDYGHKNDGELFERIISSLWSVIHGKWRMADQSYDEWYRKNMIEIAEGL